MPKLMQAEKSATGVQAVLLALNLLELIASERERRGITALAKKLGTSKTRVFRYLKTLAELGYVIHDPATDQYRPGSRLARLGASAADEIDIITIGRPILRGLRDRLNVTVALSKVEADTIYVIEQAEGPPEFAINIRIGAPLHLISSAQGKLVLAFGSPKLLDTTIKRGLTPRTPFTITDPKRLKKEIATVRERGWATSFSESTMGLSTISVPIFDAASKLIGTISVLGSTDRIPSPPTTRQLAELRAGAITLGSALNGPTAQ